MGNFLLGLQSERPVSPMRSASHFSFARAAVLLGLLAVAWLLPGAHEVWCPHDHSGAVHSGTTHVHHGGTCCASHGHSVGVLARGEAESTGKTGQKPGGPRYLAGEHSVQELCPLSLLSPTPTTTGKSAPSAAYRPGSRRSDLTRPTVWVAGATRFLMAPKNSPPEQSPRRTA